MKKIYIYTGIGAWMVFLLIIVIGITTSDSSDNQVVKERRTFQMNEVVTHPISDDHNIAVKVTDARIILDSKTPQTCIMSNCIDDRKPGKYVLSVMMDITNLGNDEYYDSPYSFEIEDNDGKRYGLASRHLGFNSIEILKGESYKAKIVYDVDLPMSQYTMVLKKHWSDTETAISLDNLQKFRPSLCQGTTDCFGGFVKKIVDGDTLDILDVESGEVKRIRLSLVDTPETGERNFENAKDFTAGFCPVDSYVLFDEDDGQTEGSFDRMIGKLLCEGEPINASLLEHELAVIDTRFCGVSEYSSESWAKDYGCN
ncbi:MAG: hypothetical protein CO032_02765 [Nitrosopumilales archaeon CG_4_9_14_0_2_um_filter_34_16]|nr:MAG: hypothetical protein CO032_02765 [Nitrosopumilales archaeon CG_4_9_14_0_2_um_filter_34_16]